MSKWEYTYISAGDVSGLTRHMNELAEEGWEFVHVFSSGDGGGFMAAVPSYYAIAKRPRPIGTPSAR